MYSAGHGTTFPRFGRALGVGYRTAAMVGHCIVYFLLKLPTCVSIRVAIVFKIDNPYTNQGFKINTHTSIGQNLTLSKNLSLRKPCIREFRQGQIFYDLSNISGHVLHIALSISRSKGL